MKKKKKASTGIPVLAYVLIIWDEKQRKSGLIPIVVGGREGGHVGRSAATD